MIHSSATMVISENIKEGKYNEEKADICIVRDHACGF